MNQLDQIFAELGISEYLGVFVDQGFDTWETILDITESDLDALGVKLGHRRKLQRRIANHRGLSTDVSLVSPPQARTSIEDPSANVNKPTNSESKDGVTSTKRKYRRHPKPDEHAPERPPSAYVLFSNKMREDLKGQNLTFTEIAKLVGENWQSLDRFEKEPYESQAQELKDKYNRDLAEYKKTDAHRAYNEYLADFRKRQAERNGEKDVTKRVKVESEPHTRGGSASSTSLSLDATNGGSNVRRGSGSQSASERAHVQQNGGDDSTSPTSSHARVPGTTRVSERDYDEPFAPSIKRELSDISHPSLAHPQDSSVPSHGSSANLQYPDCLDPRSRYYRDSRNAQSSDHSHNVLPAVSSPSESWPVTKHPSQSSEHSDSSLGLPSVSRSIERPPIRSPENGHLSYGFPAGQHSSDHRTGPPQSRSPENGISNYSLPPVSHPAESRLVAPISLSPESSIVSTVPSLTHVGSSTRGSIGSNGYWSRPPSLRTEISTGSCSSLNSYPPRTPSDSSLPIHALLSSKPEAPPPQASITPQTNGFSSKTSAAAPAQSYPNHTLRDQPDGRATYTDALSNLNFAKTSVLKQPPLGIYPSATTHLPPVLPHTPSIGSLHTRSKPPIQSSPGLDGMSALLRASDLVDRHKT